MTDNLLIGPDAQTNDTLSVLRRASAEGDLAERVNLMPGLFLLADPALQIAGRYRSDPGRILDIEATPGADGAWFGLHLDLPARDLEQYGFIGFACRSTAPEMHVIQPCLRSGHEDGFVDCFFDKHILALPEPRSHLDGVAIHHRDRVPVHAPWRQLILFMPVTAFSWSLLDLRVLVI